MLLPLLFTLVRPSGAALAWCAFLALALAAFGARAVLLNGLVGTDVFAGALVIVGTEVGVAWSPADARYFWPLLSLVFAIALLAVTRATFIGGLLGSPPLRYAGRSSNGIYLFHYPVMRRVEKLMAIAGATPVAHPALFVLASFGLTIALASASYFVLERLLQRWGSRVPRAR